MSINRTVLVGRLTRDPELRTTAGGTSVLSMRLAFNTRGKNSSTGEWEDQPNFIDVTLFGNRADALSRYLNKGSQIGVDGRLRWREWETPAGEKRSAIEVIADEIEFVGGRSDNQGGGGSTQAAAEPASGAGDDLQGEEIPF